MCEGSQVWPCTRTIDEYGCASLEKISDPSNVLCSHPIQATETALQVPLATLDDAHTFVPAMISVTLPRELVERILLFLDTKSILTCKLVNREFNQIIQSSPSLQYFLACKAAGVIDNPRSPLSCAERLEALLKREDAWKKLSPVFETMISVNHQTDSQICRSTEGVYFLSDNNLKDLLYCHLTSFLQDNPQWNKIQGHGPVLNWSGILVNFATALREHDLIVNFISSDIGNQEDIQLHSLYLVLLEFSTGKYHPLARRPRVHIQTSVEVEPWVVSTISGDNIALILHSTEGTFSDNLFVFDWKAGHKLLQHEATENAYSDLVFVSPELLLVTNPILAHFEVWHIPPHQLDPKLPIQILSLQIPVVSPEYSLFAFDCYGEPNIFLHSMPYLPPQPFFSSPENSIIIVHLGLWSYSHGRASYNLIMHRHALLDTIQTLTSPSLLEQQEYLPTWLTNEVDVHQTACQEDGTVELDAHSMLVSTMPHPNSSRIRDLPIFATSQTSRTFPTLHISINSGSSSGSSELSTNSSTSRYTFLLVPWAKWGPPISRWFQVNETQAPWVSRSSGQRYTLSEPNPLDKKLMISVVDFNPYNYRRNAQMTGRLRNGEGKDNSGNCNNEEGNEEENIEILDDKGVFLEEVCMGLKCVIYRAPDEYDFDVVLMDQQRLLGLKLNSDRNIESVKVLHIG